MPRLPAICENPYCGTVFQSGFVLGENASVTFIESTIRSGPCPSCGSSGITPNGEYSALSEKLIARIFDIRDIQYLKRVKDSIEKVLNKNSPNPRSRLKVKEPSWREIWSLVPRNKNEAQTFLMLVLAFIATAAGVISCSSTIPDQNKFIEQSYDRFYEFFDQPKSHNENSKPQRPLPKPTRV